ncbi:glycoside hydrolase family 76 protein [uncultured Hymenobacter sp.]|uniref:glycoside hydrolase family 76 protein n=1 Tax=uncultured Hymenobacter sp. TaxID=170016 RepID=UPI0035CBD22E
MFVLLVATYRRQFVSTLAVLLLSACSAYKPPVEVGATSNSGSSPPSPAEWAKRADSAQVALRGFVTPSGFLPQNNAGDPRFNYWWQAHFYDVLLDGYARTRSPDYLLQLSQAYGAAKEKNDNTYLNEFYDDMEWHALACLRAYELTQNAVYKATAQQLWLDIKNGWNPALGGISWKKTQRDYRNTPANAPAAMLAARFYQLDHDPEDLEWAQRIYQWQKDHLVDPATGTVWDGVNRLGDGQVDRKWKFSYCQGVYVGAGLALFRATQQPVYLQDAVRTASYAINDQQLAPAGILKAEGEGDGGLFKGVFVRYLTLLAREGATPAAARTSYVLFLKNNAQTLWQHGTRKPETLFNTAWTSPPSGPVQGSTQLSGLMLLEALAELEAAKLL